MCYSAALLTPPADGKARPSFMLILLSPQQNTQGTCVSLQVHQPRTLHPHSYFLTLFAKPKTNFKSKTPGKFPTHLAKLLALTRTIT